MRLVDYIITSNDFIILNKIREIEVGYYMGNIEAEKELLELIKKEGDFKTGIYKDYEWAIHRRQPLQHLCGYVSIKEMHPAYGIHDRNMNEIGINITCHGGITFGELVSQSYMTNPITTFIEEYDEPEPVLMSWWMGFDCAHSGDFAPNGIAAIDCFRGAYCQYRNMDYVFNEIKSIIDQLIKLEV
jgi:hypothetical protein